MFKSALILHSIIVNIKQRSFWIVVGIGFVILVISSFLSPIKRINDISYYIDINFFSSLIFSSIIISYLFYRDMTDNSIILILSKPITRSQYILSRITGSCFVCFIPAFTYFLTITFIAYIQLGELFYHLPFMLVGIGINIILFIALGCFLSLVLTEKWLIIPALLAFYLGDMWLIEKTKFMLEGSIGERICWYLVHYIIPTPYKVQTTTIQFSTFGIYELSDILFFINVAGYSVLLTLLASWFFRKRDL